ncbi:hypothetical protein ACFVIY_11070 [Streptomyces sp. NPDC127166]|uniref:hypothetical protein n=1 Tax=Streptomyces sp. NPDC127166 TaxID=3345380 RepID=UPI0036349D65
MNSSYEDLRESTRSEGGLRVVTMGTLRDIEGAGRLGNRVLATISDKLKAQGMGHFPAELPGNQDHEVRVYLRDSPVADLVDAVFRPSSKGDEALRRVSSSTVAEDQLRRIREILG